MLGGLAVVILVTASAARLEAQRKKGIQPAPLPVAVNTVSPGVVLVTWLAVQKVSAYEVFRCEGTACTLKTRLSAFAPREMRDNLTASGTYLYRVTAFGGNQLPLAEGQVGYAYTVPAPVTAVLMPPPSGTVTPMNKCTTPVRWLNMGMIRITIRTNAPSGADFDFEAWDDPLVVGHAVDRALAGTNPTGAGWTPLANTCDSPDRFSPMNAASGRPGYWFRDDLTGLTPGQSYQYRARGILSNGDHYTNVSPPWPAPPPLAPLLQPPTKPTLEESDEIILWIRWDQPTTWNGMQIRRPDEFQIAGSWGLRDSRSNTRCPCAYPIRKTANMPTGQQTIYITARWATVSATVSQWVVR